MDSRFDGNRGRPGDGANGANGAGPTPECARVAPLLEAFYDDALDEEQTRRVAAHVSGCPFCAARMRHYAEIDRLVRAAPAPVAGPALRAGVYGAIAATEMRTVATPAVTPRERRGRPMREAERSDTGWSQLGRSFPGTLRPVPPRTPRAVWAAAAAAVCVIVAFAVVFVASRPPRGPVAVVPTASATPRHALGILPAFHDWRAAYLDQFDGLHVLSLDGKTDTLITTLSGLSSFNSQSGVGVSSDGRYLAYVDNPKWGNIHIVDLATSTPAAKAQRTIRAKVHNLMWSPDGRWLVAVGIGTSGGTGSLYRVDPITATMTLIPGYSIDSTPGAWLDADHLLIYGPQTGPSSNISSPIVRTSGAASETRTLDMPLSSALSSGPYTYYVVDVAAGTIQEANGLTMPAGWTISIPFPGTTQAVVESGGPGAVCGAPCPGGTPVMTYALVDYSTGQITKTPKINGVANGTILSYAVVDPIAGSGLFVAAPYVPPPGDMQLFLFDPAHDGARPLATGHFAVDWTPDGQTLLLGDAASQNSNTGVGTLSTLSVQAQQVQPTVIGQNMVKYIGLVRSA